LKDAPRDDLSVYFLRSFPFKMASAASQDDFPISLRHWPASDNDRIPISQLIQRINEQKGSFRDTTEASLQDEIRNADIEKLEESSDSDEEAEEDVTAKRIGDVANARNELLKHIALVQRDI
jgi:hypothetical protein